MNGVIRYDPDSEENAMVVPEGIDSLVKGAEAGLLEQVMPLVRRQQVRLDLGHVQRIDAAGIAALITLYRSACEAGQCFGVTNPTPHVREILRLVGLDKFLIPENQRQDERCPEPELAQSAA